MEEITKILQEFNYTPKTIITINGIDHLCNEYEIRALQVLCKRYAEQGRFAEFCKKYTVWSGINKEEKMNFRKDGNFTNEFVNGFFTTINKMLFEIL